MRSFHQDRSGGSVTTESGQPQYADRVYRSAAGVVGGVLLLAVAAWLGGDAVVRGTGHTPWLALAVLLLVVPLIVAFTLRPAVYAGAERIRVRNPFRTITLPWSLVDQVRSSYSTELFSGGRKFQLWAIPVSIRARKRAIKQTSRARAGDDPFGAAPGRRRRPTAADNTVDPSQAWADRAVAELRELAERHGQDSPNSPDSPDSSDTGDQVRTEPSIRWCYEVIAPAVAGAVVLIVLLAIGG